MDPATLVGNLLRSNAWPTAAGSKDGAPASPSRRSAAVAAEAAEAKIPTLEELEREDFDDDEWRDEGETAPVPPPAAAAASAGHTNERGERETDAGRTREEAERERAEEDEWLRQRHGTFALDEARATAKAVHALMSPLLTTLFVLLLLLAFLALCRSSLASVLARAVVQLGAWTLATVRATARVALTLAGLALAALYAAQGAFSFVAGDVSPPALVRRRLGYRRVRALRTTVADAPSAYAALCASVALMALSISLRLASRVLSSVAAAPAPADPRGSEQSRHVGKARRLVGALALGKAAMRTLWATQWLGTLATLALGAFLLAPLAQHHLTTRRQRSNGGGGGVKAE